jgi:phosphatidylinositol alpha-1,6-mannosyltransferase
MKILLVSQNYHPFVGGVEIHARQVAHELAKAHSVTIAAGNFLPSRLPSRLAVLHTSLLAPSYHNYQDGAVPVRALTPSGSDRLRLLPISARALPVVRRRAHHRLSRFGYPWYRAVFLPRLRELVQGTDVVHSLAGGYLGWTAQAAAQEQGVPFICTPFVHPHQWGDDPASVAYYKRADAVIALVESDRRYLRTLGVPEEKLHVIGVSPDLPATVDPDRFRHQHGLNDRPGECGGAPPGRLPVVLYVGRMMPQKGARALRQAADLVWRREPRAQFVFVGPRTQESAAWFSSDDSRALVLGKVSGQEKADALAACDVFCMPSMSEILPTVYLEAWSCGKPVVGGRAPGLPELVEGSGAGIAVTQDPHEISMALLKLLQQPALRARMGERGRELVSRRYSVEAVVGALESLYARCARSARAQSATRNAQSGDEA